MIRFNDILDKVTPYYTEREITQLQKAYADLVNSCVDCHRQASRYQIDPDSFHLDGTATPSGIPDPGKRP